MVDHPTHRRPPNANELDTKELGFGFRAFLNVPSRRVYYPMAGGWSSGEAEMEKERKRRA